MQVADRLTPLNLQDAIVAFAQAYKRVMGELPTAGCLACLVAQSALETGNWHALHCWNYGNIKASDAWIADGRDWCEYRCNELIGGVWRWFDPPHPQCRFRAYADADAGAAEQIGFVALRERYALAWHWCCQGEPNLFVRALGLAGYFTAPTEPYARAVVSIHARIMPACAAYLAGDGARATDEDAIHVATLVAATLWQTPFVRANDAHLEAA